LPAGAYATIRLVVRRSAVFWMACLLAGGLAGYAGSAPEVIPMMPGYLPLFPAHFLAFMGAGLLLLVVVSLAVMELRSTRRG